MRGRIILVIFFLMFTIAALVVPYQTFPGNFFCTFVGTALSGYTKYLSAVINGVFYGVLVWSIFVMISGKLKQEK